MRKMNLQILLMAFFLAVAGMMHHTDALAQKKKVGYYSLQKTMDSTAATVSTDPVLQMLQADPNLEVTLNLFTAKTDSVADISPYDVIVIQEAIAGDAKILMPNQPLGLAKINKPVLLNKTYAFKTARALPVGSLGTGDELVGNYCYLKVAPEKQSNKLFKGITFSGDTVALFKSPATDLGAVGTKALNYAKLVVISDSTTLLGQPSVVKPGDVPVISISDIPAGTVIGGNGTTVAGEVLGARMIVLGMNFGAMCKDGGTNMTEAGYQLWKNAIYSLANISEYVPSDVTVSTVAELKAALAAANYEPGKDITITLNNCADAGGIYLLGTTAYPFPQYGTNLTIKAAEGQSPRMWGSFISSNGMKVKTITFDGLNWDGGDSTLAGYNAEANQPFTLAPNDSIMTNFLVKNCTFKNLDNQRIFRANNPTKAVCKLLTFEKNTFDNMGWNRLPGVHGNTFIQISNNNTYECDNFVFRNNIVKNFHGNQLFNMPRNGTTNPTPSFSVTIENNTFYKLGGHGTSNRNFLEYSSALGNNSGVVNINNNLIYERWSNEKFPQAQLALFTPAAEKTLVLNVNNNLFFPDTVCARLNETQNLVVSAGAPTTTTRNDLTLISLGITSVFESIDELTISKSSKLFTAGSNGTYIGGEQCYIEAVEKKKEIIFVRTDANKNDSIVIASIANYMDGSVYNVTELAPVKGVITIDHLAQLNAADVVIMGRSIGSNEVASCKAIWDSITAPVLSTNLWGLRSNRAMWTPSAAGENKATGVDTIMKATIIQPNDPVFEGITAQTIDWWSGQFSTFGVDAEGNDHGNGTVLVMTPDGKPQFMRWAANIEFYPGAGHAPKGDRSYIGSGSDDQSATIGKVNYFAFSETAKTIFFNELARLASGEPTVIPAAKPAYVPLYTDKTNMIPDPEMKGIAPYQGWGHKAITYSDSYSGWSSMKFVAKTNGWPDGAALDVNPITWEAYTNYRVRFMYKTMDGTLGLLAKGTANIFLMSLPDTKGEWAMIDTTFATGAAPGKNFITINNVDKNSTAKVAFIDNWELYNVGKLPTLADKKIVFVTGNDKDSVQYNWLVGNGAQVIKFTMTAGISTASATLLDTIKGADLIIIGRSPASSTIQAVADKDAWNALTNPLILNSQYIARNTRINWFNSATINAKDVLGKATVQAPTDAVFSKVTPVNNMIEWSIPKNDILDSVKQTNGTVLATYENVTSSPLFVRFAANTVFYEGTTDKPAGPRTYFGFGNDASGVVNFFPLPVDAQKVYWAEILRMLGLPITEPTKFYIKKSSDATLSALTLSAGELKPAFSPTVTAYSVNLPTGTTAATITATATDAKATVAGAGAQSFAKEGKTANIVVTAEDGTTKTYTVTITVGVGVNDLSLAGIKMYPNPAKEYINLSGMKTNAAYSVFNAQGKQMDAGIATGNNVKLNLNGFDSGIYLIRVDMNGQVYNSRFVKQ